MDAVVQSDGKVLEAISQPGNQFAVERFLTASGAIDTSLWPNARHDDIDRLWLAMTPSMSRLVS